MFTNLSRQSGDWLGDVSAAKADENSAPNVNLGGCTRQLPLLCIPPQQGGSSAAVHSVVGAGKAWDTCCDRCAFQGAHFG